MKTTPMTRLTLLAALGCAACAQVEAEVPEAQVTQRNLSFQGMGQASMAGEVSTMQSFTLDGANLSWVKDLNSKVYINQVDFRATSGIDDLSFIHYAHVTMSDPENMGMPVVVLDYARPDGQPPTLLLTAKTLYPVDISQVWQAKRILVTVALAGTLPEKPWTADTTLYLSGKISYKL
jgi:hypothetical protein